MQSLRRHLLEIVFQPEGALSPSIRLSRRKSPLLAADFAIKFMADSVKEERMFYLRISQSVSGIVTLHSTRSETARLTMK